MTTSSTSTVSTSSRTAAATLSTSRARTSIARASPASAAANSARTGLGSSVGHCRATADPDAIELEAAALAARAERAGGVDRDVADLARDAARAAPEPAAEHEAGREAGAEVEVGHRLRRRAAEQRERAERRRVHVVLDAHGTAEARLELAAEVEAGEAEVHGVLDPAGGDVDRAGDADADRDEVVGAAAGELGEPAHGLHRGGEHRVGAEPGREPQLVRRRGRPRRAPRHPSSCRRCRCRPAASGRRGRSRCSSDEAGEGLPGVAGCAERRDVGVGAVGRRPSHVDDHDIRILRARAGRSGRAPRGGGGCPCRR